MFLKTEHQRSHARAWAGHALEKQATTEPPQSRMLENFTALKKKLSDKTVLVNIGRNETPQRQCGRARNWNCTTKLNLEKTDRRFATQVAGE